MYQIRISFSLLLCSYLFWHLIREAWLMIKFYLFTYSNFENKVNILQIMPTLKLIDRYDYFG